MDIPLWPNVPLVFWRTDTVTFHMPPNGVIFTPLAGDPSAPTDGQVWYDSGTDKFRARENGVSVDLRGGGSSTGLASLKHRAFGGI